MEKLLVGVPFYLISEINHKGGRIHKVFLTRKQVSACVKTLHLWFQAVMDKQLCSTYGLDLPQKHHLMGLRV